ncbi:MAG: hypothetical protein PHI60_08920, partial [Candidatus Omnitrophica bacterium]|nr:hypothetical protein [Candidatus Omnitrophota bacterium]
RHLALLEKVQRGKALSAGEMRELKKLEGKGDLPAGQVETVEQVAAAFGVSVRTAYNWFRDGCPKSEDGGYDLIEIQAWRSLRGVRRTGTQSEKDKWDIKYREMKALLAEIEYKKRIGELIPKEEVEAGMINRITAVKMQFLALPKRVAPQLEGLTVPEREALLSDRLKEIIRGFADGKY